VEGTIELETSVTDLARRRAAGAAPLLLDVREPWEHGIARLEGAVLIPLGQLAARVAELPPRAEIIVYCHHGHRSLAAAKFLRAAGFSSAPGLAGGARDATVLRAGRPVDKRTPPAAAAAGGAFVRHAEGGTRTPTGYRPLRPERSASTNSTTSAKRGKVSTTPDAGKAFG